MGNENGEWILYGVEENDPSCLKSIEELIEYVNKVGFLPLFKNEIPGFSVEERTVAKYWWSGNEERDPWEWRALAARSGKVAYGKFFDKKAGFVSLAWLPRFVNCRRDGYDFDARFDDGRAKDRERKLMRLFENGEERFSYEAKELAGFGKGGEKNFEGTVTELQMETYLVVKDFRPRRNKHGEPYGWNIAVYTMPETLWGYEAVTAAYAEEPEESRKAVYGHIRTLWPKAEEKDIKKLMK